MESPDNRRSAPISDTLSIGRALTRTIRICYPDKASKASRTEAAAAAQKAQADFARHQQQAFEEFLRWMETIENAKSPADLDNFLIREMALHLQDGKTSQP